MDQKKFITPPKNILKGVISLLIIGPLIFLISTEVFPEEISQEDLITEAKVIIKRFGGALKPQLKKALQTGGPLHAIEICSQRAPEIADHLSRETGWQVKRVSLKARNHNRAMPDAWESAILADFNRRQQAGEPVISINQAATVGNQFRFMQAQGVEPICLACHGEQLSVEVKDALKQYYPQDQATGYRLGEIRGAFSVAKTVTPQHAAE